MTQRRPGWSWYDNMVEPWVDESALWPVLFAVLAHVSVGLGMLFITAYRGDVTSGVMVVAVAAITALPIRKEVGRRGRPGGVCLSLGLTWLGAVVGAVAAVRFGLF